MLVRLVIALAGALHYPEAAAAVAAVASVNLKTDGDTCALDGPQLVGRLHVEGVRSDVEYDAKAAESAVGVKRCGGTSAPKVPKLVAHSQMDGVGADAD